ncbi:MAG: lysophospholipid acyltransferase family protein [Armatimonadota bacterium]|nr:lysophospholipid acyltransferase family protein [Armatimonadota bacterium]MDR7452545.1 lysophospholipid acyltransferase family protein [Armatimonadota bacterium]MDR7466875.1 lysophospholipid acyltransferase family protein [Armatimonadota bacterium]MDR7492652.1 lysophospholipid acyltransferase family protein [Armatimonadota bacterium]MDR7499986.1 lysophospholipid acyltransferase family protein [Armatimonadota bacterium]
MEDRLRGGPGYRLLRVLVRGLLRAGWGLRVSGLEYLPPPPCVLAPAHGSEIDAVVLSASLPFRPTFLAARELERFPWLFRLIRWFDPVFVRRGGLADIGSVRACLARLERGDVLVIFPEGRVVQSAEPGPFHPGAAFLALRAQVPLVPVALLGLERMWPLGARWPRPSRIAVRIGRPLRPRPGEEPDALTARLRQAVVSLRRAETIG